MEKLILRVALFFQAEKRQSPLWFLLSLPFVLLAWVYLFIYVYYRHLMPQRQRGHTLEE
jgi:hypothetical protein